VPRLAIPVGAGISLGVCVIATLLLGVWPGSIAEVARDAVPVLTAVG
jgi:hypothetical protein